MKLHIQYLCSLEKSERVPMACLAYMQNWLVHFYPERMDIVAELQELATELQGRLEVHYLRSKYPWMKPIFGWKTAKWAQMVLPERKDALLAFWDQVIYRLETRKAADSLTTDSARDTRED